ncbi:MAG: MazG-like family protein [bacterium]|jgi:NTP pyrophosphatase (non-canonical NTP hydrolase)
MKNKEIRLPRLNCLQPTLESTVLKLLEEAGELAQVVGKFRGLNGENVEMSEEEILQRITGELLDVAQTTVSMMFVLEEEYKVDLEAACARHIQKLVRKGYLEAFDSN